MARMLDFAGTLGRLVYADMAKLCRYRVIVVGYAALLVFSLLATGLAYHSEQAVAVTSNSGYAFAISMMFRFLDFGGLILYVMLCLIFTLEISNSTIRCILTRSVTRFELIASKYVTAMIMVVIGITLLWGTALTGSWYYYGLGDLSENGYVIFEASYMLRQIGISTLFLLIPFAALAAMALMVSTFASTMGEAILLGLLSYFFFQILGLVPSSLGVAFQWGEEMQIFSYGTLGFPTQRFVPLYVLDSLPTGIPIDQWWSWDILKMTGVCTFFFVTFATASVLRVVKRDFTL